MYYIFRQADKLHVGTAKPPQSLNLEIENIAASDLGGIASDYVAVEAGDRPPGTTPTLEADGTVTFTTKSTPILTYEDFEARFTEAEQDASAVFIYATDPSTGAPLRPQLIKQYNRAVARNEVDLLSTKTGAFLDALVAAGVITAQRKAEILAR